MLIYRIVSYINLSTSAAPYSVAPTPSVVRENRQFRRQKPKFQQLTISEENLSYGFGYRNNSKCNCHTRGWISRPGECHSRNGVQVNCRLWQSKQTYLGKSAELSTSKVRLKTNAHKHTHKFFACNWPLFPKSPQAGPRPQKSRFLCHSYQPTNNVTALKANSKH